ncbi:hypothetical protein [Nocardia wallacei]|uniref:hypothetical protein n=1 Tax=Nocardia wallacei TaxID=480035 RepID=UPI0024565FAD|nr:hypothetical protein [Nocardia wallacei]
MKPPSIDDLAGAVHGDVPEKHPAAAVLGAALMLARQHDWMHPDQITTSPGTPGSVLLHRIGIDADAGMRAQIASLIDELVPTVPGIGNAIVAYACAWRAWQLTGWSEAEIYAGRAAEYIQARAAYVALIVPTPVGEN